MASRQMMCGRVLLLVGTRDRQPDPGQPFVQLLSYRSVTSP